MELVGEGDRCGLPYDVDGRDAVGGDVGHGLKERAVGEHPAAAVNVLGAFGHPFGRGERHLRREDGVEGTALEVFARPAVGDLRPRAIPAALRRRDRTVRVKS